MKTSKWRAVRAPDLIDAYQMNRDSPETFHLPPEEDVAALQPGDYAKVAACDERFWVIIKRRDGDSFVGKVANHLLGYREHGLKCGGVIAFAGRHIYDTLREPS
jgi:hypothetical protein